MQDLNFDIVTVLLLTFILFLIIVLRYFIISGAYYYITFVLLRKLMGNRILDKSRVAKRQIRSEIYYSVVSAIIFAVFGIGTYWLWYKGHTAVYEDLNAFPIWYLPISVFLVLFIQDTYYYWIHRWMHWPLVYKYFHKVHHNSVHTSVWTSFSFHPLETLLQAVILPLIVLWLPLHTYAILAILIIMTISATINHAGVEVYPKGKYGNWVGQLIIGATHHDVHHRKFLCNYGLYFTFWDRWMRTERELDEKKAPRKQYS
ncbi:MAG: sterol desaturase family protein [Flavobacteriaceae bacterium]